jgi:drug/metabolite transporter (DMT)-like permease
VLFIAQSLQQIGLGMTSSSAKGGFLTSLYAILVPIIEFFVYGKRFKGALWASVAMSFAGLFLIFAAAGDSSSLLHITVGDWVLLTNSVMYAVHIIVIDKWIDRIRPFLFSAIQVATVAFLSLVVALVTETPDASAVRNAAIPILYGGLASTAIGYTLQVLAQKNKNVILTSIMFSTESMFAAVGGFIILHERMASLAVFGCIFIFASVVFAQIISGRNDQQYSEPAS